MGDEATFGPYRILRELSPVSIGFGRDLRRFVGIDDERATGHLLYAMNVGRMGSSRRRFIAAASEAASLALHVLPIEAFSLDLKRGGILVTPFVGDVSGLVTLRDLHVAKQGRMMESEIRRALTHMYEGLEAVHRVGLVDGALRIDRCLVDTRGRIRLELPGMGWLMARRPGSVDEWKRDDVRTIAAIGLALCTGEVTRGREPEAVLARAPESLRSWLTLALSPLDGFSSATEARERLLTMSASGQVGHREPAPAVGVLRGLWGRVFGPTRPVPNPRKTGT